MKTTEILPLDRALAKRSQLERELKKCPDFQLYLITKAANDRARMERVLMENPAFRLWRLLTNSLAIVNECGVQVVERKGANTASAPRVKPFGPSATAAGSLSPDAGSRP